MSAGMGESASNTVNSRGKKRSRQDNQWDCALSKLRYSLIAILPHGIGDIFLWR